MPPIATHEVADQFLIFQQQRTGEPNFAFIGTQVLLSHTNKNWHVIQPLTGQRKRAHIRYIKFHRFPWFEPDLFCRIVVEFKGTECMGFPA